MEEKKTDSPLQGVAKQETEAFGILHPDKIRIYLTHHGLLQYCISPLDAPLSQTLLS